MDNELILNTNLFSAFTTLYCICVWVGEQPQILSNIKASVGKTIIKKTTNDKGGGGKLLMMAEGSEFSGQNTLNSIVHCFMLLFQIPKPE